MSYARLKQQNYPQTIALTSDKQFISPNVRPYYTTEQPLESQIMGQLMKVINSNSNGMCSPEQVCKPNPSIPTDWTNDPDQWGPHLWYYLHTSAMNYPIHPSKAQQTGMKNWLCSLKWTIPCENCSSHYGEYIDKHKHKLNQVCASREELFKFLVNIHNEVNKRNGKPTMTVEEAKKMYARFI